MVFLIQLIALSFFTTIKPFALKEFKLDPSITQYTLTTGFEILLQTEESVIKNSTTKLETLAQSLNQYEKVLNTEFNKLLAEYGFSKKALDSFNSNQHQLTYVQYQKDYYSFSELNNPKYFVPKHQHDPIVIHFVEKTLKKLCPKARVTILIAHHLVDPVGLIGTADHGFYLILNARYFNKKIISAIYKNKNKGGIIAGKTDSKEQLICYIDSENLLEVYLLGAIAKIYQNANHIHFWILSSLQEEQTYLALRLKNLVTIDSFLYSIFYSANPLEACLFLLSKSDDSLKTFLKDLAFSIADCYETTTLQQYRQLRNYAYQISNKSNL